MEALTHTDSWTDADERELLALPEVEQIEERCIAAGTRWSREIAEDDPQAHKVRYRWGQRHAPWEAGYIPPPMTLEQRLDSLRQDVKEIRSEIRPFGEPLVHSFEDRLAGQALSLPAGLAPVGPDDQVCLLIYGFDLEPNEGEVITRVKPRLTYTDPVGLTYTMVPSTELEERFRAQSRVELGVAGEAGVGVPDLAVAPFVQVAGKAAAKGSTSLLWRWEYRLLKAKVVAHGTQSGYAEWDISKSDLVGRIDLKVLLRLPRRAERLTLDIGGSYSVRKKRFARFKREREAVIDQTTVSGKLVPSGPGTQPTN